MTHAAIHGVKETNITGIHDKTVIAETTSHQVVTKTSINQVIALTTINNVGSATTKHQVIA